VGENSGIAWTHDTFNPWMGCLKVSPGCEHCYAEQLVSTRFGLPVWGPPSTTPRQKTNTTNWKKPLAWDRAAAKAGKRTRVFCASLADVFEDHPMVAPWRMELFAMIEQTPHLDWQLLTKRPENFAKFLPAEWLEQPRANVWLGCTVEDEKQAFQRIRHLVAVKAVVRFLSCEPLLEAVELGPWLRPGMVVGPERLLPVRGIDWVIVGGESGPSARPFDLAWARSIRDQCASAGVAFFCKQVGAHPRTHRNDALQLAAKGRWISDTLGASYGRAWPYDRAGADPAEWPDDLRVQQFPEASK